jgi:pyocin large subunit-like protein
MKGSIVFAAFSAAFVLGASLLCGCTDHNADQQRKPVQTTTTTEGIVEWTTKAQKTTAPAASGKKTGTTTEKKRTERTTASGNMKDPGKTTKTSSREEPTTTVLFDNGDGSYVEYHFRNKKLLNQHFEKHGAEFADDFDYRTAKDYEKGASDVINNSEALHKTDAEDGDDVYYIEVTNEFVILSKDGYIRTYFRPNGGLSYYNRQ